LNPHGCCVESPEGILREQPRRNILSKGDDEDTLNKKKASALAASIMEDHRKRRIETRGGAASR
jgi:hypothetical protein